MATLVELAAEIVSSHASNSPLSTEQLLSEIQKVYAALQALESGAETPAAEAPKAAITVKDAFKKNEVVCMICSKGGFKTLTRHLKTAHDMKPGAYRKQFGIARTQPLAARSFSESRRQMAQDRGLGDVLAKAREKRAANLQLKHEAAAHPVKPAKSAKAANPAAAGTKATKAVKPAKAAKAAPAKSSEKVGK
jgi:predicted transcriptional regulator